MLSTGTLDTNGNPARFLNDWSSGTLSITGSAGLDISSSGPLSNSLVVSSGKTLNVTKTLNVASGATYIVTGAASSTLGSITGSGEISTDTTVTVGTDNTSTTFNGLLSGPGGTFVKTGSGTLTLTGANTYSGATTINAGTILANNGSGSATGSSAVAVNNTATLGGSGTVSAVTANSGGTISPGTSVGTLSAGSATFKRGSTYFFELSLTGTGNNNAGGPVTGTPGSSYDTLRILSGGTLTVDLSGSGDVAEVVIDQTSAPGTSGFEAFKNYVWRIVTAAGTFSATDAEDFALDATGFDDYVNSPAAVAYGAFTFTSDANGVYLNYAAAPEPTTTLLFGAGCGSLLLGRWRRRRCEPSTVGGMLLAWLPRIVR
jgi:autotransporter-associated beta strand protein